MSKYNVLGIDTSNYTTSIALVEFDSKTLNENLICEVREKIKVKKNAIGIRQSEAHFQHCNNLPVLFKVLKNKEIDVVAVSTKPRNVEGSYMPVFLAGESFAKTIATLLNIPILTFSHQDGHIAASHSLKNVLEKKECVFMHLSGGTTEVLRARENFGGVEKIGGTLDISIGQLLDRVGGKMGYDFPAGIALDKLALSKKESISQSEKASSNSSRKPLATTNSFKKIKTENLEFNLSGIETAALRDIGILSNEQIAHSIFERIGELLVNIIKESKIQYDIDNYIIGGGVANSAFLKEYIKNNISHNKNIKCSFAEFADDNAVGIARLGGFFYGE